MSKKPNEKSSAAEDSNSAQKKRAIEAAVSLIEKNHGKGAIMSLGSQQVADTPVISTGCIQLDMALGVGGLAKGRVIEIYGPESSGK
ncbi:MAG TPA: DNA recombination/repair protein RecA, partial [Fibrobacteria bacterium]|nr:DNA recombination/repair protein RecA [Fibrobacteria bacterium]